MGASMSERKRFHQFRGRNFVSLLEFGCWNLPARRPLQNLKDMFVETLKDVNFAENAITL